MGCGMSGGLSASIRQRITIVFAQQHVLRFQSLVRRKYPQRAEIVFLSSASAPGWISTRTMPSASLSFGPEEQNGPVRFCRTRAPDPHRAAAHLPPTGAADAYRDRRDSLRSGPVRSDLAGRRDRHLKDDRLSPTDQHVLKTGCSIHPCGCAQPFCGRATAFDSIFSCCGSRFLPVPATARTALRTGNTPDPRVRRSADAVASHPRPSAH